jgi:GH24 family phage-related lysozyme (muramidase)
MTPELFAAVSANLAKHEGRRLQMYLDSVGVCTIGIGHALFAPAACMQIPFWRSTNELATREEISAEYDAVKRKLRAAKLLISYEMTEMLLRADLKRFETVVGNTFSCWEQYPQSVQVALFDIAFNTGSFAHWPKFSLAIQQRNFKAAAAESHRPQVSEDRNKDTYTQLFV